MEKHLFKNSLPMAHEKDKKKEYENKEMTIAESFYTFKNSLMFLLLLN